MGDLVSTNGLAEWGFLRHLEALDKPQVRIKKLKKYRLKQL